MRASTSSLLRWGVVFAPDHSAAARELARVCRPGGRLGLVSWRPNPEYAAVLEPLRAAPEPGAGDPDDWGREEHVLDLLGDAFELTFVEGSHSVRGESAEAIWRLFTTAHGPFKSRLESLAPIAVHSCTADSADTWSATARTAV